MQNLPNFSDIFLNQVLVVSALVWLFAELTKVVTAKLTDRPARLFDSGGMPSAHAAIVSAAVTVIALTEGFASPLFGLAFVVAAIVLHDSCRVRYMAGETTTRVNELSKKSPKIRVHRGHTLLEVAVGTGLGVVLAAVLYSWLYA